MNIKQAKEQIQNAMTAYFTKDRFGNYKIPIEKQRPIFLMGPPGIGKTAIMEQVAQELGVGLVCPWSAIYPKEDLRWARIQRVRVHHVRDHCLGL